MKKYYISLAIFIWSFLSCGCGHKNATVPGKRNIVSKQVVIVEHEKYHDFDDDEPGFGILFYKNLDDDVTRMTMYDGYEYDYVELGDTLVLEMSKKTFRKEYNKHNTMFPEEMNIDPDSVLYKKNQTLKHDSLVQAKRNILRKKLIRNPLQIVASKAERIRK